MHAAEHRALRELWAFSGALERHWTSLSARLGGVAGGALQAGASAAGELRGELRAAMAQRDIYGEVMAGLASRAVSARPLSSDALLERNQALRMAVLDVQHVVTTLGYLARLAAVDGDDELRALLERHRDALTHHEQAVRELAVAMGDTPDAAIAPADPGAAGRIGQKVGYTVGSVGEFVDRQLGRRRR